EVNVGRNAFVDMALFGNDLGGQALDRIVEIKVFLAALGFGQLLYEPFEDNGARVGQRVDRVAHTVDQALAVKGLLIHNLGKVGFQFVVVGNILDMGADVVAHLHDFNVGAAVLGAFQAGKR